MRNIPMFTTESGVGSLTLREIPYTQNAYITLHDASDPDAFIKECYSFCKAAGADKVFVTGKTLPAFCVHYTDIWQMQCLRDALPDTDAALFPVQDKTMPQWRDLYNTKMRTVPNASWMTAEDATEQLRKGSAYYIHRGDQLIGIGVAGCDTIDAVISVIPGGGRDVLLALNHALSSEMARLTVASANIKAIRLYEDLGFVRTGLAGSWYLIPDLA